MSEKIEKAETKAETEAASAEEVKLVCPFNVRRLCCRSVPVSSDHKQPRISGQVNVDKETLVVKPVVDMVDLDAEIQTYKGMCGLEYFKMMLAQGKVDPSSSHDDGKHSVDMSTVPETIHDAAKVADSASAVISEVAKQLGIKEGDPVSEDKLIELLSQKVASNLAAKGAPSPKEGE